MEKFPILPKLIYDDGFLRVRLPSGELLPETTIKIENEADQKGQCFITVSFLCDIDLNDK